MAEHWGLKAQRALTPIVEKNKATATEGIEGMTPNTQVRGIMPKQRVHQA